MKREICGILMLLALLVGSTLTVIAQEGNQQQQKKVAYNFINEYGFWVGKNAGMIGVFVNGVIIKNTDAVGVGVGYGLNDGTFQEIPIYLNYRHYFDRGRKLKPLLNVAAGAGLHFWTECVYDDEQTEYPVASYVSKNGVGLYSTISGGFRVKALSFTGGFFFRTLPNEDGFCGGIEAKVGYTF